MLKPLLVQLRAMQLFAHSAHNLVAHVPFFQDHEFFGDAYSAHEKDYDDVAERNIGLYGEMDLALAPLLAAVSAKLQSAPSVGVKENSVFFQYQLQLEMELCKLVAQIIASGCSEGTKQLLGDICNASESRQYKIKQRIKR
jgi:DNA-binding ferritin-like protein